MSIDRGMDKKDVANMCVCVCVCVYKMEYYSVIKSEIMPFAETWMDLETTIQSEMSEREK